jgi:cytochrome c biogenesis protein CcdA
MITSRIQVVRPRIGLLRVDGRTSFAAASYVLCLLCVICAALLLPSRPELALLAAAVLCGWSEVDGLCGSSHVGTITPLRVRSPGGSLWLKSVSAYTLGGIVTACCVGLALGGVGRLLRLDQPYTVPTALIVSAGLALVLVARELGVIGFSLPQIHRQTHKAWAVEHGMVVGAAMWGAHIGLGFATVIKHGGFFVIVLLALAQGPVGAAVIMTAYWIGRTLPLWFAGTLAISQCSAPELFRALLDNHAAYRHVAAIGLLLLAVVAVRLTL